LRLEKSSVSTLPFTSATSPTRLRRVAIVVPEFAARGGLASVALFVHRTLRESGRYEPHLISLAISSTDSDSVRLLAPSSWRRGVQITPRRLGNLDYLHVGSVGAELEPFRYRPRAALTRLLDSYDVVQLVAGSPAFAHITRDLQRPVALQCATMAAVERRTLLKGYGAATMWRRLMTAWVARMDETGAHHADITLVENAWMRDRLTAIVGPQRVRFSPPGVDTAAFHSDGEPTTGVVLAVGRLDDPRKNIEMLVEAFAIVRERLGTCARLVLAGERPPTPAVMTLARRLGVADAIELRLSLSTEELARLYRMADVFAVSSDEEGLGIAALEAMASGVPVVATRCGGPETSVVDGETGYLVPIGGRVATADRLMAIISDRHLRGRMGRAARERVAEHFSLEKAGARFLATYDELLGRSSE
jgi:glycosyltransferase involved in cell wall biosynthesis